MKKILFSFAVVLLSIGCKKDTASIEPPTITVTSPANNQSFLAGERVNVVATVNDVHEIHHVELKVVNAANSVEVLHFEDHVDAAIYNLNQSFAVEAGVTYHIEIEATDHNDKDTKVELMVMGSK